MPVAARESILLLLSFSRLLANSSFFTIGYIVASLFILPITIVIYLSVENVLIYLTIASAGNRLFFPNFSVTNLKKLPTRLKLIFKY